MSTQDVDDDVLAIFSKSKITDAKRLVRAFHLQFAKRLLLARSPVRLVAPSVLMFAGGAPEEEIGAIKSLWPRAHILAVDRDERCVRLAEKAGASETLCRDLLSLWDRARTDYRPGTRQPPPELGRPFELVDLDFCSNLTSWDVQRLIRHCAHSVVDHSAGIMMVTFSYGRDVKEYFEEIASARPRSTRLIHNTEYLLGLGMDLAMAGRLQWVAGAMEGFSPRSVLLYPGHAMPMCATLWQCALGDDQIGFARAADDDLREAIEHPNEAMLYGIPSQAIAAIRRRAAARKAVQTRERRLLEELQAEVDQLRHRVTNEPTQRLLPAVQRAAE